MHPSKNATMAALHANLLKGKLPRTPIYDLGNI